jgi:hypothetical protein
MNKLLSELKCLQEKATEVNGYIRELKSMIKNPPININNIPIFHIGKCSWDEDCEPSGQQKYYAFLLYYRKVLKEIEKQLKIKKRLVKVYNKESKVEQEKNIAEL